MNCAHKFNYGHKNSTSHSSPKRGSYCRHTAEFKRVVVAKSLISGISVSRIAREFKVNTNQVFAWRKQFGDLPLQNTVAVCQLLPITVSEPRPKNQRAQIPQARQRPPLM